MKKRQLGNTGIKISAIGIGGMSFCDFYGKTTEEDSYKILTTALERGVTHIDTANVYGGGSSEKIIGSFLNKLNKTEKKVISIATKAGIATDKDTGRRYFDNSALHLNSQLDKSLKRLGLDQIDLFYVHRRDKEIPIEEVTETLSNMIKSGKIRAFGFSEIAPVSLNRAAAIHPVGAVQSEYSLSVRSPELGLVQTTKKCGSALIAFSPLGRSLLTDRPHTAEKAQSSAWLKTNPRFLEPNLSANISSCAKFRQLAADMGISSAGLAIAWLLHKGDHIIPIPGTRSVKHFTEHCDGAEKKLSKADIEEIETILPLGWASGERYSEAQWVGIERYC